MASNPYKNHTLEELQQLRDEGDYRFAHNDGNEQLLSRRGLGSVNWASPWDLACVLRYAQAATVVKRTAGALKAHPCRVLDVGCSSGTFAQFWKYNYQAQVMPPLEYLGLEVDPAKLKRARDEIKLLQNKGRHWAEFRQHDLLVDDLPADFAPHVIVAQEVIEHIGIPAAVKLLQQAFDVLEPGGTLFLSTPNPNKVAGQQFVWPESHVYEFEERELLELLDATGFEVVHRAGCFSQGVHRAGAPAEVKALYKRLSAASPGVAAALIGFLHPEHAACVALTCRKPAE